jgi:MFS superfamily sulfate permease-like transporter
LRLKLSELFQVWFLSHLHLIMVVVGLLMGAVGLAVAISFGVCYSVKKNLDKNPVANEQYRSIVADEEVDPDTAGPEVQVEQH